MENGEAEISVINADDPEARYTYDQLNQYLPVTSMMRVKGDSINYTFQSHSFTRIIVGVNT